MEFAVLQVGAPLAAKRLLGAILERTLDDQIIRVRIVETEAYDERDAASHSYRGRTTRTSVMFGPAGYLYVYFTYGLHYCCNIVTGQEGEGSAVLIRAVEPIQGQDIMTQRRQTIGVNVSNGPAKICQALGINRQLNGHSLSQVPLILRLEPELPAASIGQTLRIGITKAKDTPWRFYIRDNLYVSNYAKLP